MQFVKRVLLCLAIAAGLPSVAMADNGSTFTANRTDFRDESIYFVMTTRFYDGDPKNNVLCWDNQDMQKQYRDPCWRGDFQGIIDKLDYIKALGFSAIWITPVVQNASGYDYHGYHAMDFSKVDSRYLSKTSEGSAKDTDFKTLIDAAHRKGLKIILDIVLNHTGNFGEENLCKEFTHNAKPTAQGSALAALKPNFSVLGEDYLRLTPGQQYQRRLALMKNTDGKNHDVNNYWHHFGNFNWDNQTRWWAQIAGDCVDLNTENPDVYKYLVKCYGEFIKLGVDGFRIDTSGHIARLTFNKAFIPQFEALGRQYAGARQGNGLGTAPFYMFGEVCARFGGAVYRDQAAMSPFFYTWKSETGGHRYAWSDDASEYRGKEFPLSEGLSFSDTNRKSCEAEYADYNTGNTKDFFSRNAWLDGNNYHTPDYSNASGFNVIDFPVHYNFSNAGSAYSMATGNDQLYNDATWNVVYVDSHDYGPQPNDQIRFNGGTAQWAENLTWMFLFRGIPCIYYGSEVEFMAGAPIDRGPNGPLAQTGRAYFGQNLEGDVTANDFGTFTASGQVAKTLAKPLAQHLSRLNRIRQAVPALRKGQYSTEGCAAHGGFAWKKRYTQGNIDSYALVCMNGGATFTGILNGVYTDCITGDSRTVTNGTLQVNCSGQGNARVYVLNGPGKIGNDGPFLFASSPASADNSSLAKDPGTTWNEVVETQGPSVTLSPAGGNFSTDTQTINLTLANAREGWYQVGDGEKISISGNTSFVIGSDMKYGESKTVRWSATGTNDGTTETVSGTATYTKTDPNAAITVYVKSATAPKLYAWSTETGAVVELNGKYPGNTMTSTVTIGGQNWYAQTFANAGNINIILSDGSGKTEDIKGITANSYYLYNGGINYEKTTSNHQEPAPTPDPQDVYTPKVSENEVSCFLETPAEAVITAYLWKDKTEYTAKWPGDGMTKMGKAPNGNYIYKWTYTGTAEGIPSGLLFVRDGQKIVQSDIDFVNHGYYAEGVYAKTIGAGSGNQQEEKPAESNTVYFVNKTNWTNVSVWVWDGNNTATNYTGGTWPGRSATDTGRKTDSGHAIWKWTYSGTETLSPNTQIVFSTNRGGIKGVNQTYDLKFVPGAYYEPATTNATLTTGINTVGSQQPDAWLTLSGMRTEKPTQRGIYIHNGRKYVVKQIIK